MYFGAVFSMPAVTIKFDDFSYASLAMLKSVGHTLQHGLAGMNEIKFLF